MGVRPSPSELIGIKMSNFILIEEYIKKSKEERQTHLRLDEPCIKIGGIDSSEFRGLLAHYLNTTIPTKLKIVLAHACHNGKESCSNPRHLYWATFSENTQDAIDSGQQLSAYEHTLRKYGLQKLKEMQIKFGKKGGKKGGKISAQRKKKKFAEENIKLYEYAFSKCDIHKFGWIERVKKYINRSHTQIRRVAKKYFSHLTFYKRKDYKKQ